MHQLPGKTINCFLLISPLGERQKQLSEAMERVPPKAYIEAMEALLRWLQNNEDLLASEKFTVNELPVMEKQLKHFKVHFVMCI